MQTGQIVTVKLYGGATAKRRVVAIKGDVIVVCAEEEFQSALQDGRPPSGLGFPAADVLEGETMTRKGAASEGPIQHQARRSGD